MSEEKKKCMVCAKPVTVLKGGICERCQERIRREALGEQSGVADRAEQELTHQGVPRTKK
jgi:predicted amidophosphoribosyltransferase